MAAFVKKEPNSDLYESDQSRSNASTYHTLNYSQESSSRNLDRARWSEQDMEILFAWFQDPQNLASYTNGVKAKAMRAMAEKIPGKTDRQVLNKMTALENHYNQCKTRLKQGIPLTERDLECGIDSAQAKVKSIFRYYYEMDQILGSQPQAAPADTGYNHQSRIEDQPDYDSPRAIAPNGSQQIPHHSLGEQISPSLAPTSNRPSYPPPGSYTPETYPQETFNSESFPQSKYASQGAPVNNNRRNLLDANNDALPSLSSIRSESHIYPQREAEPPSTASRRDPSDSYLTLAPLNTRHGNSRSTEHESNERGSHNSRASGSTTRERRLRLAEEKLAFKRARHQEVMALAYRQIEAEEEARKVSERQHRELIDMRQKEYQLRFDELTWEKSRLANTAGMSDRLEPHIIVTSAKGCEANPSFNLDTTHSNPPSFPEGLNKSMDGVHLRNQVSTNP